jgi:adenine-specific DNA-methyltransferase
MKKIDKEYLHDFDLIQDNINQIKNILPDAFTEDGVDFEVLRQLMGDEVAKGEEKYGLNWYGKNKARQIALTPSNGTLRPCPEESVDWDRTQNLFVEGDNLEVLKLLQKGYANKIKMIYIDPPYNTGKEFIYPDKFQDNLDIYLKYTGQKDDKGFKISSNTESSGRYHTNWLNMIYPRLKLARNLLRNDGVLFVSIDDNEIANLRKICDEVMGEENFRNCFAVRRYDKNLNRQFIESGLQTLNIGFEYILTYAKSSDFNFFPVYKQASEKRQNSGYWKGFWNSPDRPTMRYDILGFSPNEGQWKWKHETAYKAVENYKIYKQDYNSKLTLEEYWDKTGRKLKFIRRNSIGSGRNRGVEHWIPPSDGILRNTNLLDILASQSVPEIQGVFDFPKNKGLLSILCSFALDNDDTVLDFFAGSCTTAHAVLDLNKEDDGNRKFIMVQLPEICEEKTDAFKAGYTTIAEIGKERIRKVATKINDENLKYKGDLGLKVFKLDSSNIIAWNPDRKDLEQTLLDHLEHLVEDRSEEDVLYELLLKRGVELTVPIEEKTITHKTVYSIGYGVLFVCLDTSIGIKEVEDLAIGIINWYKELAPAGDTHIVFRDSAFVSDIAKTNMTAILEQYGIAHVRSL